MLFVISLLLFYGMKITVHLPPVFCTVYTVWLMSCCFDGFELWYRVDILTVSLFVWQWSLLKLHWPSHIIYQGSLCAFLALISAEYYMFFQTMPWYYIFGALWLVTIEDT